MGRSRGKFHAEEDPSQRSRRKKSASNGENAESFSAGQGSCNGKPPSYHCNYCNKDITGCIRIKCAVCSDFDLCIECMSVGAEVHPHKSDHPYRVMDSLSFPLICSEWNADAEMLLLEGIEMYGMGNWAEVAEHVGTKSKEECIDHYKNYYLNSPCFPLPDMAYAVGKNRKELLAMAKGHLEDKKGEIPHKEESPFSLCRVKIEDSYKTGSSGRLPSAVTGGKVNKKASNAAHVKDQEDPLKMEDQMPGRSFGGHKPKSTNIEAPSLEDSSGYNRKRREFDPEYDNDAEQLLADMEFKETDAEEEREIKMRVLHIYNKRLDERKMRKDFIIERNLLYPSQFEKGLSQEEIQLIRPYDVFRRLWSEDDHEELLKAVVSEHRIKKRMADLKDARAAGCRKMSDVNRYLELRRREAMDGAHRKDGSQAGPSSQESLSVPVSSDSFGTSPGGQANSSSLTDFDSVSVSATSLLSESEKQLCREIRLAPSQYLKFQEDLTTQILVGNISTKSDAQAFFQVNPSMINRVYDMLVRKGIAPP